MNALEAEQLLERVADREARDYSAGEVWQWQGELARLNSDAAHEALRIHWATSAERVTPQHLLDIAREMLAPRLAVVGKRGRAVMPAYSVAGAINEPCERCHAEPGEPCLNPDGTERKIPDWVRIKAGKVA